MTDDVDDKLAKIQEAQEYFKVKEKDSVDTGKTISNTLVEKFSWLQGDIRKRMKIDVNSLGESIILDKQNFRETQISTVFVPGSSIYFNSKGAEKSGMKNIFTRGFRALDSSAWQNYIKEGFNIIQSTGVNNIKFEDMFDTWWLIKSITNYNITVTSFSLNTSTTLPNLILVEPDYVSIRYPSEEDLDMYKKYELGSTVTQADLMNKLAKAFGQKI